MINGTEEWLKNKMKAGKSTNCGFLLNCGLLFEQAMKEARINVLNWLWSENNSYLKKDVYGIYFMHYAALNNYVDVLEWLLEKGVDIHVRVTDDAVPLLNNNMPIHLAASHGHIKVVEWLLSKDKDLINSKGYHGQTPMHQAAASGQVEIMKCLNGADIYARDDSDFSPMDNAVYCLKIDSIKFLKEKGFDWKDKKARNSVGQTPMFSAALGGSTEIIEYLVKLDADVNVRDNNGYTPIFIAVQASQFESCTTGHIERIECLAKLGADVNARDNKGRTPIFHAVTIGYIEDIECLKRLGAKLDLKDKDGMTLIDTARAAGHSEDNKIMNLLKKISTELENDKLYTISPKIVELFGNKKWFSKLWKPIIDKIVCKLRK